MTSKMDKQYARRLDTLLDSYERHMVAGITALKQISQTLKDGKYETIDNAVEQSSISVSDGYKLTKKDKRELHEEIKYRIYSGKVGEIRNREVVKMSELLYDDHKKCGKEIPLNVIKGILAGFSRRHRNLKVKMQRQYHNLEHSLRENINAVKTYEDPKAEAIHLLKQGKDTEYVSEKTGLAKGTVSTYKALNTMGCFDKGAKKELTPKEREKLDRDMPKLISGKMTNKGMAAKYGLPVFRIVALKAAYNTRRNRRK